MRHVLLKEEKQTKKKRHICNKGQVINSKVNIVVLLKAVY